MPSPKAFKAPFHCGQYYHLVFKSIDGLLLFKNDANRIFFLEKFSFFMGPVCSCFAYCMLDNHVHFVVCVKENQFLIQSLTAIPGETRTVVMKKFLSDASNELLIDELVERQANRFMVSYANAYNKMYKRKGNLFQSPFRRSIIDGDQHLHQAIIYVHANAQKHGLIKDYRTYPYSSYQEMLLNKSPFVDVAQVLHFFGNVNEFIKQHDQQVAYYYANKWPPSKIEVD